MNQLKLTNKNIVISAAADGIGWCIADFCLNEGANVFISDIDENKLKIRKNITNIIKIYLFIKLILVKI